MTSRDLELDQSTFSTLNIPYQKIIFGALGTGQFLKIKNEYAKGHQQVNILFHANLDYTSFVGETIQTSTNHYFVPQAFAKAYVSAWMQPNKIQFIIIEGINLGDCSKILGNLIQSFDRDDVGYSRNPVNIGLAFSSWLFNEFSKNTTTQLMFENVANCYENVDNEAYSKIILPPNLYIYATMNTCDGLYKSMAGSFKRVWDWECSPIDYYDANSVLIELSPELRYSWGDFLEKINQRILKITGSEAKLIGNRFVNPSDGIIKLEEFKSKILSFLWLDIFISECNNHLNIFQYQQDDLSDIIFPFMLSDLYETSADKWYSDLYILSSFMKLLKVNRL